uniref:Uncharacterized protein n=1 Tax=Hordeum vulgare subsp. vulgare TaxID=112509 RepID=A0A8I6WWW5_HORVV
MFNFAHKVVACIADTCTCYKLARRKQCVLKTQATDVPETQDLVNLNYQTPVRRRTTGPTDNISGCGESSAIHESGSHKRSTRVSTGTSYETAISNKKICVSQPQFDHVKDGQPQNDPLNINSDEAKIVRSVYNLYDDLSAILVTYYAELRPNVGYELFGTTTETEAVRTALPITTIAREPWAAGSLPAPPSQTVLTAIHDWFSRASSVQLDRIWIVHPNPRMVSLTGIHVQQ